MMSDRVKQVKGWTTMDAHVYDGTYQWVMTISCCDFQSEDKDAQFSSGRSSTTSWPATIFHIIGFMAGNAQTNWNVVHVVYGIGDPKVPMERRERTCYFH